MSLLQNTGFTIHPIKSPFVLSQEMMFLGLITNTKNMTITLINEKNLKIHAYAKKFLVDTPLLETRQNS